MFGLTGLEIRALAIVALIASAVAGYAWWHHEVAAGGAAEYKASQVLTDQAEEQRRVAAQKEVDNEDQRLAAKDRDAAARLARAAGVLRPQIAALIQRCDSAPSSVGPAASSAADLLTYVQSRVDEAARGTIDYADGLARSGGQCAGDYDALTPPAKITLGRLVLGR